MSHLQSNAFAANWQQVLSTAVEQAEGLVQSQQRRGKLTVQTLVQCLVLGCLMKRQASLNDFVSLARQLGVKICSSSLHERLTARLVMVLVAVFEQCLRHHLARIKLPVASLQRFSAILLVDSTQISLPAVLYKPFQGNGLNAKLKLQVALDYLHGHLVMVQCEAGRTPDQRCDLRPLMHKDALLLFDLGYFSQETLHDIDQANAFFVTRCQSQVAVFNAKQGERIDLLAHLAHLRLEAVVAQVWVGARRRTCVRVIARRVSAEVASARRRRAHHKAKQQGKTCSAAYLDWLTWDVLLTNLPVDWKPTQVFELYGVRWQIELLFKSWKSQLGLACYGEWGATRVMCQFYAHLIGAVLCQTTLAPIRWWHGRPLSLAKTVTQIQAALPALIRVIAHHWRGFSRWTTDLYLDLCQFAPQDTRKTHPGTLRRLMNWGLTECL